MKYYHPKSVDMIDYMFPDEDGDIFVGTLMFVQCDGKYYTGMLEENKKSFYIKTKNEKIPLDNCTNVIFNLIFKSHYNC